MKKNNQEIEQYRLTQERISKRGFHPRFASDKGYGNNGMFLVPQKAGSLLIMASDGKGWEHVSVSVFRKKRCPIWAEMCLVKDLFWHEDEVVIQYHPRKEDYVSFHDYVLHMWRPIGAELPTPPSILVGPKNDGVKQLWNQTS